MLHEWIEGYERAWASNDPDDIRALFAEDALYLTEPYAEPWNGHDEIVARWVEARDEPGDYTFDWQPLVDTPDLGILTGTTTYHEPPRVYSNLWVIRLASDGRCREFVEWYMKHPAGE